MIRFVLFFLLIASQVDAATELSTSGTNIGIGTTSIKNALSIKNRLVVGSATYTNTTAPINGALIEGNVGIGSLTPANKLDVGGNTAVRGTLTVAGGTSLLTFSTNSETLSNNTDGFITSSGGLISTGNVGVGSTAPGKAVDVVGTVRATAFQGDGSALTGISGGSGSGTVGIGTTGYVPEYIGVSTVGTTSTIKIVSTNVGIGSALPGTKLDVQGAGRFSSTLTASNLSGTNTGDQTTISGNAGTATALAADGTDCSAGNYPLGVDASGNAVNCTAVGAGSSQWITNSGVGIGTTDSVGIGTTLMSRAGLTVMNGNVGIGTWVPGFLLDVTKGSVGVGTITSTNDVGVGGVILEPGATDASIGLRGTNTGRITTFTTSSTGSTITGTGSTSSSLRLQTVLMLTTGNVGINTTSGGSMLSVNGGISAGSYATSAAPNGGALLSGNVGIGTITANEGRLIVSGGNVGIGTTTPQALFSVIGGNVGIGTWTAAGGNLIVNSGGNVGIGTAWPGTALDVNGTVRATAFSGSGAGDSYLSGNLGIGSATPGSSLDIFSGTARLIGVGTTVPQQLCRGSDGKIGYFNGAWSGTCTTP